MLFDKLCILIILITGVSSIDIRSQNFEVPKLVGLWTVGPWIDQVNDFPQYQCWEVDISRATSSNEIEGISNFIYNGNPQTTKFKARAHVNETNVTFEVSWKHGDGTADSASIVLNDRIMEHSDDEYEFIYLGISNPDKRLFNVLGLYPIKLWGVSNCPSKTFKTPPRRGVMARTSQNMVIRSNMEYHSEITYGSSQAHRPSILMLVFLIGYFYLTISLL